MTKPLRIMVAALCLLALAGSVRAMAATAETSCASLRNIKLVDLDDAPTNIMTAADVAAEKDGPPQTYVPESFAATPISGGVIRSRDLPAYCRVIGTVEPQVKFELRLPKDWNGKFLMQGCGGMCGIINMEATEDALVRKYAVLNTNMGHDGDAGATLWAKDNAAAHVDFGWRATHVAALAGKALIKEYYGRPPSESYFRGFSTGGDQAMNEAQRFPEDFNGILATAPAWAGAGTLYWERQGIGRFERAFADHAGQAQDGTRRRAQGMWGREGRLSGRPAGLHLAAGTDQVRRLGHRRLPHAERARRAAQDL